MPASQQKITRVVASGPQRFVRIVIQLAFLVLAPQAFSAAFAGARSIVASVVGGLPLDVAGFVAVLALLCTYTIIFGRFFCGFACAFGTFGDALYALGSLVLKLFGKKRRTMNEALEHKLRYGKYVVLVLLLLATALGVASLVTATGPWTAFGWLATLQPAQMGIVATVVLTLVCIPLFVKERAFCEFLCPLGAIFALLPQLRQARFVRYFESNEISERGACTECGRCQRACPVGIYPVNEGAVAGECLACGRCAQVCPEACVARGRKSGASSQSVARILVQAVLLFVLLWACGSVNFIPSPSEIFIPEPVEEPA